jgi:biopolymer transport protein ExbB
MKRIIVLALSLILMPQLAQAWWNDDWGYRKKISIDAKQLQQQGVKPVADGLMVVRLHTGNFAYFLDLAENGKDLRFIAGDDKTPLKFYIEKLDAINEMAIVWVKLPNDVANSAEPSVWMYYGNPAAVAASDAGGIFDVTQVVAYHFNADAVTDATAYGNQPSSADNTRIDGGAIGDAAAFDGNQSIRIAATPAVQMAENFGWTLSAWIKIDQPQDEGVVFERDGLMISVRGQTPVLNINRKELASPNDVNLSAWHHLAVTGDEEGFSFYVDGKNVGVLPTSQPGFLGDISIGGSVDGSRGLVGAIDEFGIAKAAREQNTLAFNALMQGQTSSLLIYGEDATPDSDGGSESRIMAILNDVTIDGWVIIGMLMLMLLVSWIVMLVKALTINKNIAENRKFEDAFQKLSAADMTQLDREMTEDDQDIEESPLLALTGGHGQFAGSSLYQLYHVGVQEVNMRLAKAVGADVAGAVISDKAINTVRAAMESILVREVQKINSQMVLLTIAISGGPFLGLLGTVLGVMITFGDIAASGEVNVNAIAPGIAAALATTVAGLVVAIPALFGYNYLASRIKLVTADMYIFVDEFSAKLSERYSD